MPAPVFVDLWVFRAIGRGGVPKHVRRSWAVLALLLALACLAGARSGAQSLDVGMTHHAWGLEDGLPDRVIQAIAQTRDGYLWLGTPHALVRFDGARFVLFSAASAPALREFGVSALLTDKDGTLWAGSVGGGVTHSDERASVHFGRESGLEALTVRALYQSNDGSIWAGTDRGLYRGQNNRFTLVPEAANDTVTAITSDGSDGFWVAGGRLQHFEHGQFHITALPPLRSVIRSLAVSPEGTLWIGTTGALLERNLAGTVQTVRSLKGDVRALCFDRSGRLWIGTIGSGLLLRTQDGRVLPESNSIPASSSAIRTIVRLRSGDMWVGTHTRLVRLSNTGMDFLRVAHASTADYGSVFLDSDDSIWLSAGTLSRYRNGRQEEVRLPLPRAVQIRVVLREQSGAFWIGTVRNGAYRITGGKVQAHVLKGDSVTGFMVAPDGAVWIGTDHGLAQWSQGRLVSFPRSKDMPMTTVKAMAMAPDGSLWIATPTGLFLFRQGVYQRPAVSELLSGYRIWSLCAERNGSLWIGAGAGLYLCGTTPYAASCCRIRCSSLRRSSRSLSTPSTVF